MPLNNSPVTQPSYTAAQSQTFITGRPGFAVQVANAGVFYQVGILGPAQRDVVWESQEHFTMPAFLSFDDPTQEGFPPGSLFAGIRFRTDDAGDPANVTVM